MSLLINIIFIYNPINFLAILYPTSLANLVVAVGARHTHQTLLPLVDCIVKRVILHNSVWRDTSR